MNWFAGEYETSCKHRRTGKLWEKPRVAAKPLRP